MTREIGISYLFGKKSNTNIKTTLNRTNNSERQQKFPITQQVKKKKSEALLQQTEMDESHPKFREMQKQIPCLITETKHLKTCDILTNRSDNESSEIAEQDSETAPFLPKPPSLGKYRILQRRENATNIQPSKNLQGALEEDRGVTKQEVKEVLKFVQNTMQTLTIFEKRFNNQQTTSMIR